MSEYQDQYSRVVTKWPMPPGVEEQTWECVNHKRRIAASLTYFAWHGEVAPVAEMLGYVKNAVKGRRSALAYGLHDGQLDSADDFITSYLDGVLRHNPDVVSRLEAIASARSVESGAA